MQIAPSPNSHTSQMAPDVAQRPWGLGSRIAPRENHRSENGVFMAARVVATLGRYNPLVVWLN